jgi:thiamine biosynthesis lipoprotein
LVVGFGLWFGDLLSLALLAGWARHGVPWQTAPVLVLLAALALVVPWATQRQLYCQQLCPHGAVQEWLGRFRRLHAPLPLRWQLWLRRVPAALLVIAFALGISVLSFDLSVLEPFDAWILKGAAIGSAIIAVVGLIASLFVPQAYCRFGCPTGALLKFIRSGGGHDRFRRRDAAAAASLAVAALFVFLPSLPDKRNDPPRVADGELQGKAFGTTWTVKLRGNVAGRDILQQRLAAELERIESTLSHWRPASAASQFNSSETTFEMDQPPELVALVAHARKLSEATDGGFDITIAPLVNAWGYGPDSKPGETPDDAQIAALLERVGWQKLEVDVQANTLRKTHPLLQIDLGALLQGHAVDRLAGVLDSMRVSEYLIEIGGELRAKGSWTVAVEDPAHTGRPLRIVQLSNTALATSGTYRTQATAGEAPLHHLISPQTGRPVAASTRLCAVVRPTCLEADGWATALLLAGFPRGASIADNQGLPALFVDPGGQVLTSAAGAKMFEPPLGP